MIGKRFRSIYKAGPLRSLFSSLCPVILPLLIVAIIVFGMNRAETAGRDEGGRLLREAVMRAAVHNFAARGYFPASLSCIIYNYGIYIDSTRFVVHYQTFAPNILPDVRVFERQ